MGYYTGNGVVISRRATPVCHAVEWVPTWLLDGVPQGWRRVVHTGVTTETVAQGRRSRSRRPNRSKHLYVEHEPAARVQLCWQDSAAHR